MKAFILALLLLIAAPVYATDVTMTATTQPNFHPSGLPSATTGSCTATATSPTVTGSWKSTWVGIGGFKIKLGATDYEVLNVTSTTSLTLTTPFTGTSGSVTYTVYPFVLMRFYALQRFTASGTNEIIQPGAPGSSAWYRQVGCSIINNTLYIPQLVLPSTVDAVNPGERNAKWFAGFYQQSGTFIVNYSGFEQFPLDPAPNPKTWQQALAYSNQGTPPPPNTDTYSKTQIDALFTPGGTGPGTAGVTSITAGTGLQGGGTGAVTLSIANSLVAAGGCTLCNLSFNQQGQITAFSNGTSSGPGPGGPGTVTSITAGPGLTGGTITTIGTISMPDVTAASSCTSCDLTFDAKGRITLAGNGTGGPSSAGAPGQYVISFPAGRGTDVDAGFFWPAGIALPVFTYEAWVKQLPSGACGCYIIADGGGGSHSILWGFEGEDGVITGNITTNGLADACSPHADHGVSYGSIDPIDIGEWQHQAVVWNGSYMLTYVDGVPSGVQYFPGPRAIQGPTSGTSQLYVAGSDHNNFTGYISALRGFEGDVLYGPAFRPQRNMIAGIEDGTRQRPATLLYDFTQGEHLVHDLSQGFLGLLHHGRLYNQVEQNSSIMTYPSYVVDSTAPMYDPSTRWSVPVGPTPTPPSTPSGALIFDSFSRPRQTMMETTAKLGATYISNVSATASSTTVTGTFPAAWVGTSGFVASIGTGGYTITAVTDTSHMTISPAYAGATDPTAPFVLTYGTTESGTYGPMPWIYGAYDGFGANTQWGIMSGQAVLLANLFNGVLPNVALVDAGLSDVDIYVDRPTGSYASYSTSLAFRYQDNYNFWYITVLDRADWLYSAACPPVSRNTPNTGYILCRVDPGGEFCQPAQTGDTALWTTLRVLAKGDHIQVYAGTTLKYDIHDSHTQTATKHGFTAFGRNPPDGGPWAPGPFMRWDNFTIKAAP